MTKKVLLSITLSSLLLISCAYDRDEFTPYSESHRVEKKGKKIIKKDSLQLQILTYEHKRFDLKNVDSTETNTPSSHPENVSCTSSQPDVGTPIVIIPPK